MQANVSNSGDMNSKSDGSCCTEANRGPNTFTCVACRGSETERTRYGPRKRPVVQRKEKRWCASEIPPGEELGWKWDTVVRNGYMSVYEEARTFGGGNSRVDRAPMKDGIRFP